MLQSKADTGISCVRTFTDVSTQCSGYVVYGSGAMAAI